MSMTKHLCLKFFREFAFRESGDGGISTPSRDRRSSEMELDQRPESWCIDSSDLFVNLHLAVPVMKGLITPSHDSRDSEMELHQ
jgi:hypothetical protein